MVSADWTSLEEIHACLEAIKNHKGEWLELRPATLRAIFASLAVKDESEDFYNAMDDLQKEALKVPEGDVMISRGRLMAMHHLAIARARQEVLDELEAERAKTAALSEALATLEQECGSSESLADRTVSRRATPRCDC